MNNTIPERITDFLKAYPPFNLLDKELLRSIASRVVVQYRQPGEIIFRQGEMPGRSIYVVREGAVHLLREENGSEMLIEQCDEGDVFGIRPLLAEDAYALTARVVEESLLYAVNLEGFEQTMPDNPRIAYYLASNLAVSAAKNYQRIHQGKFLLRKDQLFDGEFHLLEIQSLDSSKEPVNPLGIITDKDLRHKVATGLVPITDPVTSIMTSPVVTAPAQVSVAEVQIEMVRRRIHHLCLTLDGTDQSPVLGVISEHDLLVLQGNNPAVLIREIRRSQHTGQLRLIRSRTEDLMKKYLYQEVAIAYIASIVTEINDALIERVLELCESEMELEGRQKPDAGFCRLALGSEGRGEQLLRTDQDNALVFDNVDEADYAAVQAYYLDLAGRVNDKLNTCGFEYCPAETMAGNPLKIKVFF